MSFQRLDGKPVADAIRKSICVDLECCRENGLLPTLAIVRVGSQKSSIAYERSATKELEQIGLRVKHYIYSEDISEEAFLKALRNMGASADIHGILILQPLPEHICLEKVAQTIPPEKDVDGMHPYNLGLLMSGSDKALVPSTAKAVMSMIDFYDIPVAHQNICVIGKSNTVGKPLTIMLLNRHGTVSNCHTRTRDLASYTQEADIIVCAAGAKYLVTANMVKPGVIIIDIGYNINRGKVYGDADYEGIGDKAAAITPVPGGVGAVTTVSLAEQVILAAKI